MSPIQLYAYSLVALGVITGAIVLYVLLRWDSDSMKKQKEDEINAINRIFDALEEKPGPSGNGDSSRQSG